MSLLAAMPYPALLLIIGGLALPFLRAEWRAPLLVALPVAGALWLWLLPEGAALVSFAGYELAPLRVDGLSRLFASVFFLAAFLGALYAWQQRDLLQQSAAAIYAGSAIGAALAGDFLSFFLFWEGTSFASFLLVLAPRTPAAWHAAIRYGWMQLLSGLLLLAGMSFLAAETGSLAFDKIELIGWAGWLIFLSFGIKAAFPLLHNWLQDAYPASSITGTVFLSAFSTKLAIYALARGFPGTEFLIYIGAVMTLFPIFYAVIENDLRRVLAYSLNNQLGFMVAGIGIGTPLALNGTAAHAFCHIIYKALLFMSIGAVMFRTGTSKATELGGLYKSMPYTMLFCVIGAASISAFPLFSGFISKSLILSAAYKEGYWGVWLILLFASAGVFHHSGIKIPYFTFYAHDAGWRVSEAPKPMLLAMGLAAALCILLGVFPQALYAILPYDAYYWPYDFPHIINGLQLLVFSALAFSFLMLWGYYPPEMRSTNLDSDWAYRTLPRRALAWLGGTGLPAWGGTIRHLWQRQQSNAITLFQRIISTPVETVYPAGTMAVWLTILLALAMIFTYA